MGADFSILDKRETLPEICERHGVNLWRIYTPIRGSDKRRALDFCPECSKEEMQKRAEVSLEQTMNKQAYQNTYHVLMRDSTIPEKLKSASFDNFVTETDEERRLLTFAKGQAQKYLDGMTGNTFITGGTGIGKTHLSIAMAKAINDGFRDGGEPKRVLFANLTEIIKRIKEGWNYGHGAKLTEQEAVRMLAGADYLFLDDLGAKNAVIKPKSDWEQDFLFDILNDRENTIVNTNLSTAELGVVYNDRNRSRLLEGLEGNSFKAFSIQDKRYTLNKLKNKEKNK